MNDIQPDGYGEDAGLVVTLGGTITSGSLDGIEWTVIVVPRGAALAILGVVEFRIQMPTQPNEPLEGLVKPIQKEVGHANDQ